MRGRENTLFTLRFSANLASYSQPSFWRRIYSKQFKFFLVKVNSSYSLSECILFSPTTRKCHRITSRCRCKSWRRPLLWLKVIVSPLALCSMPCEIHWNNDAKKTIQENLESRCKRLFRYEGYHLLRKCDRNLNSFVNAYGKWFFKIITYIYNFSYTIINLQPIFKLIGFNSDNECP